MSSNKKADFPVDQIRRFLEPGPVILVGSTHGDDRDIITMGWHMMLGYERVGCYIWDRNHSRELIEKSRECVINVPTFDLIDAVIGVGNTHGPEVDMFAEFGLSPVKAKKVGVPLIASTAPRSPNARLWLLGRGFGTRAWVASEAEPRDASDPVNGFVCRCSSLWPCR